MTSAVLVTEEDVLRACDSFLATNDPDSLPRREILGRLYDAGLAWLHFPVGCGGLAATRALHRIATEKLYAAGVPRTSAREVLGHGMTAPTINAHGTHEQRLRYLRPIFTGEEVWCQLFSEPGAGSDLAALATRAERDGDDWVINGQKVWTSIAHLATHAMLIVRTNPDVEKHKGLTYFLLDMRTPGVEVRPLRQMTGEAEFNEVFLTDVRISDTQRVGEVGDGWRVALTTLMNERVLIGGAAPARGSGPIADALDLWQRHRDARPELRDQLVELWSEAEVLRLTNIRAMQARQSGTPGPEGSVGKLVMADLSQRISSFCLDLMGPEGMLYGDYDEPRPKAASDPGAIQRRFLRARANSIEGGTSEIMRNIIGERVLGLPPEIRSDKDRPWSDVPRN